MRDNSILYKFHQSNTFRQNEDIGSNKSTKKIVVGWGVKEGPLTHRFNCGNFNEQSIVRNNLYLEWSELGKKPMGYWHDKEPNEQARINALARPHITFRAKFAIALQDSQPSKLDPAFVKWFDQYKQNWLQHHGVQKWDEIDEYCSPLPSINRRQSRPCHCTFQQHSTSTIRGGFLVNTHSKENL